jgi:hypothetical protein
MSNIKLFQNQEIRSVWDAAQEPWLFSVINTIQALTGNARPRKYWSELKKRILLEGSQLSDKIGQLKMRSADGKSYLTDVATTENLLVAHQGGQVARNARTEIEAKTGKKVVRALNAKQLGKTTLLAELK